MFWSLVALVSAVHGVEVSPILFLGVEVKTFQDFHRFSNYILVANDSCLHSNGTCNVSVLPIYLLNVDFEPSMCFVRCMFGSIQWAITATSEQIMILLVSELLNWHALILPQVFRHGRSQLEFDRAADADAAAEVRQLPSTRAADARAGLSGISSPRSSSAEGLKLGSLDGSFSSSYAWHIITP